MRFTHPFILASASPRRSQLLSQVGFDFSVYPAKIVEEHLEGETAASLVTRLAASKADKVSSRFQDAVVLAADTIVVLDGQILGKPDSSEDAVSMLQMLAGRTHTVYTAFALHLVSKNVRTVDIESAEVTMDNLPIEFIHQYVETGSPMDKAGSYGIQDMGAFLVKRIEGDFYTVMGLPLHRLYKRISDSFSEFIIKPDYQFKS